ncbi:hypothetical protein [Thalassospira sp. TSL5-1]|uniref:hypothetical protein n=1 Tax=Thalassospira sp. TSL5-1 TaxID=1544451 RepID=UPI000AAFCC18|nr:hypothetical protein [Thalassospira sp. TSL5-1]
MTDDGPIPPLLRQIGDALNHVQVEGNSSEKSTSEDEAVEIANILALFRSVVKLWSAQNAMLCGDAPLAREWMQARLGVISHELDGLVFRLDQLAGKPHGTDMDVALKGAGKEASAQDGDRFELIDFFSHLKGRQDA